MVSYTYDSMGRMLTRDDGSDLTTFTWDGFDMVREVTGESVTDYLIPHGKLLRFKRDGVTYYPSCDVLGSVRLVTDEDGEVVSRFELSALGSLLEGSFDGVPGGMPYTWVGASAIRFDRLSGLYYMRNRWYSASLQRFISRDPIGLEGGGNLYRYCDNSPVNFIDPNGMDLTREEMEELNRARERARKKEREREEKKRKELEKRVDLCRRRTLNWFDLMDDLKPPVPKPSPKPRGWRLDEMGPRKPTPPPPPQQWWKEEDYHFRGERPAPELNPNSVPFRDDGINAPDFPNLHPDSDPNMPRLRELEPGEIPPLQRPYQT